MGFLKNILGVIMKFFYDTFTGFGIENQPDAISYYAMAILLMAIVNKLITIPITMKQAEQSRKMQSLGPKVEELKKKYGYDEQILQQKLAELYKSENATMAGGSSCLIMIINLIIVMSLFDVIKNPHTYIWNGLTTDQIADISKKFFWIKDLQVPDATTIIAILNSVTQFLVTKVSTMGQPKATGAQSQTQMMLYIIPIMFFFIFRGLPAGLVLYWTFGNIVDIIFRLLIEKVKAKKTAKLEA